jgi:DNA-binding NarL/FixJ family response regulator
MAPTTTRILIVDDHPVVRKGLRDILAVYSDFEVVGEAGDGPTGLQLAGALAPNVVLLDVRLPGANGVLLIRKFKEACEESRVIILTTFDDDEYLFGAVREGADGYLLKTVSAEELADAIQTVTRDERVVSTGLSSRVLERIGVLERTNQALETGLTDEEIRVLRMIADGSTTREIAERIFLSEITVKRRVSEILEKLGARHRAQAVSEAMRRGLL